MESRDSGLVLPMAGAGQTPEGGPDRGHTQVAFPTQRHDAPLVPLAGEPSYRVGSLTFKTVGFGCGLVV